MNSFKKHCTFLFALAFVAVAFVTPLQAHEKKHPKPLWTTDDTDGNLPMLPKAISPDGKYSLVWDILGQILINNETLETKVVSGFDQPCSQLTFIGDGQYYSCMDKDSLYVTNIASGQSTKVMKMGKGVVDYAWSPDGKNLAFTRLETSSEKDPKLRGTPQVTHKSLYLQHVDKDWKSIGEAKRLTPPSVNLYHEFSQSYAWSPDGKKIAFTSSQQPPHWKTHSFMEVHILNVQDGHMEKITGAIGILGDVVFSPDGQKLAFTKGNLMGEQKLPLPKSKDGVSKSIQIVDLSAKTEMSISAPDLWNLLGWTEDQGLVLNLQVGTKRSIALLNPQTQQMTLLESPETPCISKVILSQNKKYIGFWGENLHYPGAVYVSSLESFSPRKIVGTTAAVDLSPIQAHSLTWTSFDGVSVEGILIYPQGYTDGDKIPLIVSIHGGPSGVESEQFMGKTWFGPYSPAVLASQGYGTLVVNYRGSIGYGAKFRNLNYQNLGNGDFQDVISGVDHIISQGIADPERLFIRGHSYGGFLTAWAVGHTHQFKAAIVSSGITDWISHVALTDYPISMESYFGSAYWQDYDLWRKTSSLSYARQVKTPTLFLHGADDKRVSPTQAKQFYHALNSRGVPTRLVIYTGEEHSINGKTTDATNELLAWIKKYDPGSASSEIK